ncbi:MAG TPA: hypothetical protein VGR53_08330 [Nitrososphaerales archaeon]|nr:hypothetical protein [Nitrososphaerales archaeon]
MSIENTLALLQGLVPAWLPLLALLAVSLVLIFAGRSVVKVIAFFVVGLIGAAIGGALAAQFLPGAGDLGTLLGVVLGFAIGGLLGVVLVMVGIGLVLGYGAYAVTQQFISGNIIPLIVGFIFFLVGIALYNKILGLLTAVAGGFLLFDVFIAYGAGSTLSIVVAAALTLAGIWVQESRHRKKKVTQTTVSNAGTQPSAR